MDVPDLTPSDRHHLNAALGWSELENYLEAGKELDKLSPQAQLLPDVRRVKCRIHATNKRWPACLEAAELLVHDAPDQPDGWVYRSRALYHLGHCRQAFANLWEVADKFPKNGAVAFDLACYAFMADDAFEGAKWLRKALELDRDHVIERLKADDPTIQEIDELIRETPDETEYI